MNAWSLILAALALVALLAIPTAARLLHTSDRARAVSETTTTTTTTTQIIEHVYKARLLHPDIVRTTRLDWHPYFLIPHVGVWCYAICVFSGATLTSNVASLSTETRDTLALCFLVGATFVLGSATMGVRLPGVTVAPKVHDHVTASVLGDDIVLPYRLSMAGQFAVSISMFIYAFTSFKSTTGSLGGWLTACLALACCVLSPVMFLHVRRFRRWEDSLVSEAMKELGLTGVGDGS